MSGLQKLGDRHCLQALCYSTCSEIVGKRCSRGRAKGVGLRLNVGGVGRGDCLALQAKRHTATNHSRPSPA